MEKMSIEYNEYQLEKISQRKINFNEKDLERPELKNFTNIDIFVKILKTISDSALICYQKRIGDIKNNDIDRNFLVLINNMKLYFYEILRIYNQQRQKFDHFINMNDSKITILKQQKEDLEIQLRAKDSDKILNDLYDEIKALNSEIDTEKNKNDVLSKENQKLKQEISNDKNTIYENENTIQELNRILKENEGKIRSLNIEKELQAKKVKTIQDELNSYLLKDMEKKEQLNQAVEKMNLDNSLKYLVNIEKADIIYSFNEKYKYFTSMEKDLKNKRTEREKTKLKNEEEINDLKEKNNSLNKKNEML
jgi:chromosome segregation ATPase